MTGSHAPFRAHTPMPLLYSAGVLQHEPRTQTLPEGHLGSLLLHLSNLRQVWSAGRHAGAILSLPVCVCAKRPKRRGHRLRPSPVPG